MGNREYILLDTFPENDDYYSTEFSVPIAYLAEWLETYDYGVTVEEFCETYDWDWSWQLYMDAKEDEEILWENMIK